MAPAWDRPLADLPDPLLIPTLDGPFDVALRPPGSKSVTNRLYMLAALAAGTSRLRRPLRSEDTDGLGAALRTLGVDVVLQGDEAVVTGGSGRFPRGGSVNLGDGGTPTRFMLAAATRATAPVTVDGSPRMRERPVAQLLDLLRDLGADVTCLDRPDCLPVRITPFDAPARDVVTIAPSASSQFTSALMLVAPWWPRGMEFILERPITSASYLALTTQVIAAWPGAAAPEDAELRAALADADRPGPPVRVFIPPGPLAAADQDVEPDASTAVYGWTAAALVPGATAICPGLGTASLQPDVRVTDWLERAGAIVERRLDAITVRGPDALHGVTVDAALAPDGALVFAAAAARFDGPTHLSGLHTLRVKETDRVAALAQELARLGIAVDAGPDTLDITPRSDGPPAIIRTYRDHRMAMAFAILGLVRGDIAIEDPGCVAKSHPGFWTELASLYRGRVDA